MRSGTAITAIGVMLYALSLNGQQQPTRDSKALAILQRSLVTAGGVPADSLLTGTFNKTAGTRTDEGTIRIFARGLNQSHEELATTGGIESETFSGLRAALKDSDPRRETSLEWAASSQSSLIPSIIIAAALYNADSEFQYIGLETIDAIECHHIRIWNGFASKPRLKHLAEFSTKEIWIDAATSLPMQVAYDRKAGSGSLPRIAIKVRYSDYRMVNGLVFPFQAERELNGTRWMIIRISSVSINSSLEDSVFAIPEGRPQ